MAFAIQDMMVHRKYIIINIAVTLVLLVTILGLGSRSGVFFIAVFFIAIMILPKGAQGFQLSSLMMSLALIIMLASAATFVYSRANADRLTSLEDESREITHQVSWQIISNRRLEDNLFGTGYGSTWRWYLQESDYRDVPRDEQASNVDRSVWTRFGRLLYHPHSVLLLAAVEMGFGGLISFTVLMLGVFIMAIQGIRLRTLSVLGCGIFMSSTLMFFDLFLFKTPEMNAFWWIFLLGTVDLIRYERQKQK